MASAAWLSDILANSHAAPVTTAQSRRTSVPLRLLVCIALLAFVTGLAYFLYFGPTYQPDSRSYIVPASNFVRGAGFVDASGHPETIRTPGYPLFLAPFLRVGLDLKYLVLFQHLLRILLIVAVTAVAFSLTGRSRPAIIAGVLLCIDLPTLSATNSVLTEMLFTVILAVALWLLWKDSEQPERRWSYSLFYGLLCGMSVLVRPISLFIFVPAGAYLLLTRKAHKWRAAISFTLAFLVLPLSWATRNYVRIGSFTLSTISGYTLLAYRAAGALAIEDPGKFSINLQMRSRELQAQACQDLIQIYHRDCQQLALPGVSDYYSHLGRSILASHKLAYIKLAARGAAAMMLGDDADAIMKMAGTTPTATKVLILAYTLPILCFVVIGLAKLWKENRRVFYLALLFILYFVVISGGGEAYSRFRVPVVPLYLILAASGIDLVLLRILQKSDLASSPARKR